jgi:hypothetical protein
MSKLDKVPALLIADRATITFAAEKDGRITVTYANWDDKRVALPGEVFEVSWCGASRRTRSSGNPVA